MDSANRSYFREDFAGGKDRTTWFSPNKIWTNCGDKVLNVDIKAANVSENITPREYADLLFDGIGAALVFNFKRLKREEFDGLKPKIDWSIVESFPFPAPFEEQRYIGMKAKFMCILRMAERKRPLLVPIPCGSCTWSISENREEEFCRASLVKDGFWHWRDYLLDITQKEDMLQVEYPNCFLLDMGWYQDRYIISIIQNFDWTHPVQQYETAERNQLPKLLTEAVRLVEKESQSAGAN